MLVACRSVAIAANASTLSCCQLDNPESCSNQGDYGQLTLKKGAKSCSIRMMLARDVECCVAQSLQVHADAEVSYKWCRSGASSVLAVNS